MTDIALQPADTATPIEHSSDVSLSDRLAALRRRTKFVMTERTLLTIGSILIPFGIVLVLLGWYGAAHTTRLFEEIPYLISGGMLGVALVVAGGFCYFGYFMARLLATSRDMLDAMLRLEERLEALPAAAAAPTRTGTMYHRPDCPTVAGKPAAELRAVRTTDGLTPCRICAPDT
jgi:hypothetical protein